MIESVHRKKETVMDALMIAGYVHRLNAGVLQPEAPAFDRGDRCGRSPSMGGGLAGLVRVAMGGFHARRR